MPFFDYFLPTFLITKPCRQNFHCTNYAVIRFFSVIWYRYAVDSFVQAGVIDSLKPTTLVAGKNVLDTGIVERNQLQNPYVERSLGDMNTTYSESENFRVTCIRKMAIPLAQLSRTRDRVGYYIILLWCELVTTKILKWPNFLWGPMVHSQNLGIYLLSIHRLPKRMLKEW